MKLKPFYLGLVMLILLGLTASSAFGVGGVGTVTGGTFPACVDPANTSTATVKLAGKQVAPGGLVRVPVGTTCLASETTLNLNSYVKTTLVSPGSNSVASGTNLQNALTTATVGTLIKVEPGTYDLGATPLTMKPGVDVEGSGETQTTITSQVSTVDSDPAIVTSGSVVMTNTSEIRYLTVGNTATGSVNKAAIYSNGGNGKLTHVTTRLLGSSTDAIGVFITNFSIPTILNCDITAANANVNFGIYNFSNSPTAIRDSTITAVGGSFAIGIYLKNNSSINSPTIENSIIYVILGTNSNYGIEIDNSSPKILSSSITTQGQGTNLNTFGILNLNNSGPNILNTYVNSTTGQTVYAFDNENNAAGFIPTIQASTLLAGQGTGLSVGIYNNNTRLNVYDSLINVTGGGTNSYGFLNFSQVNTTVQNSSISASGGTGQTAAFYSQNSATGFIYNSQLRATGNFAIESTATLPATPNSLKVASTMLDGLVAVSANSTVNCLYSYKPDLTTLSNVCA